MNISGGLEDDMCQGEGRLNHPFIGDKLGGLEVKGYQAAPPRGEGPLWERDPQQEKDSMGEGLPREGDPHKRGTPTGEGCTHIGLRKTTVPSWRPQARSWSL